MNRTLPGAAFTRLVLGIFRANGALLDAGDRLVGDLGLSSSRWQVLGMIIERPLTVSAIARRVGLTRQSVQRTANVVVKDGFARYAPNPDHATAHLLELTSSGRTVMVDVAARQVQWAERMAEGLSAETLTSATALLKQLCERVQPIQEERP